MAITWKKIAFTTGINDLQFDTTPTIAGHTEGRLYYDEVWKTFSMDIEDDVRLQVGQEEVRYVFNNSGGAIAEGQAVYAVSVGNDGGTGPTVVTVALAMADSATTAFVLGVATTAMADDTYGFVTVRGHVNNIDTDTNFGNAGDVLYLSDAVPGGLQNTMPIAPALKVRVGRNIVKHATAGRINVRLLYAYRLGDLSDVRVLNPVPAAGQLLKYDGVSWIAADTSTVASAGGTDFYLSDQESAIEGMTRAAACVVTWTGHGLATGDYCQMAAITQAGWTALNWTVAAPVFHKITRINADSFSIPVDTSGYAGDYNAAVDNGTISSGHLPNVPVTTISTQTDSATSSGSAEVLIDTYSSAVLGRTSIEGGEWSFHTWCWASSTTNTNTIVIRVYNRTSAGVETELFNVETADLGATTTLSQIASIQPAHAIAATDHLVIKYFAKSDRAAPGRILYLTHNGTTNYTYVKSPLAMSHNQLGGLKGESPWNHLSDAQVSALHAAVTVTSPIAVSGQALSHADTDGNKHVPANSTTNTGKVLTAGAVAGTYTWETPSAGGGMEIVADTAARLALSVEVGNSVLQSDENAVYVCIEV